MVRLQSLEITRLDPDTIALSTFLISVVAVVFLEFAAGTGIARGWWSPMAGIGMARMADIVVLTAVVSAWGTGMARLGLGRGRFRSGLIRGGVWSLGFGALAGAGLGLMTAFGLPALKMIFVQLPDTSGELAAYFIVGGLVAPIAEEFFFRGIVYGFFRRWGCILGVAVSTLAFVAAHGTGPSFPVTQLVGGILFAAAYELEGNLLVPIVIHITGNLALFSLSLFFFY